MNYAIIAAVVAAVLLVVRHLMANSRLDQIINSLPNDEEKAKAYEIDLKKLADEIKDADIRYSNAKRAYEDLARNSTGAPNVGTGSGEVQRSDKDVRRGDS
jgi:hypothetical protein